MKWKKKPERLLLEVTSSKETTKVTLITLKLALEPLFFFALEFLQNDRLNISSFCGIYFGITTTTLRTLDSGTNIFAKGHSSMNWKQSLEQQQSVTSAFATTLAAALDPFTERLSGWWQKKNFLTSAGTQSKRWHLLTNNQPGQKISEEEKVSAMAALMRSTDEEIEKNCKLVRDVIESQREQKEKQF